jgi:hypothetical protein
MTTGTEIKCATDKDMLEFMRWIRERGGEVSCIDWDFKVLRIIRGTENAEKVELFNVDGVLGAVNTDDSKREEAEQKRRCELFRNPEGDLLQLGYEQDLRTR